MKKIAFLIVFKLFIANELFANELKFPKFDPRDLNKNIKEFGWSIKDTKIIDNLPGEINTLTNKGFILKCNIYYFVDKKIIKYRTHCINP
tara:strand:+ start:123 stop:392 length:270 start_codon:yes stop_codon:yes gene_type:complete